MAWAATLTEDLRRQGGSMRLAPWQGYSLAEIAENRGAWLVLPVGLGKTLVSYLAPVLLGSTRPILIVPAALREKTYADFGELAKHWGAPPTPHRIVSREELAPESGAYLLEQIKPDLIFVDECDELMNARSSAVRRLDRYILAHPSTVFVGATGTPTRKSIMNYWHLLCWALRERAPVPMAQGEAEIWALALDEGSSRTPIRVGVGPMGRNRDAARLWYRERLEQTPGVVIVDGDSCKAPLSIRTRPAREDPRLDKAFETFLKTLESPDGMPVADPLSRWRLDGQLGCGLYLRYNPPPPTRWRDARRAVAKFVYDRIAQSTHSRKPLDTEAQVLRVYEDHPIVTEWKAVKPTFVPQTEAVWISDSVIHSVRDWLAESPDVPGIVWTGCVEFAVALAAATRLSYYGREGKDQHGRGLHAADPTRSMISSWHANKRGFNLQPWRRQLLVMPPQSARYLEQIFGRSHRQGQTEAVTVDVLVTSGGTLDAFDSALAEAGFGRETVGVTQKILRAKIDHRAPRVTKANRYRWARKDGAAGAVGALDVSDLFAARGSMRA